MKVKKTKNFGEEIENWRQLTTLKRWLQLGRRSLTGKMIFLFLMVILPVNILMVLITSFVAYSYERRISESYSYHLGIYGQSVENQFSSVEENIRKFLSIDNLVILTNGSYSDSTLDMIRFTKELSESDVGNTNSRMYFVWDKAKDNISFSKFNREYSDATKLDIEETIRKYIENDVERDRKEIMISNNKQFIVVRYDYKFFSIGILFDVEKILRAFYSEEEKQTGVLFLADMSGNLLSELKDGVFKCESINGNKADWKEPSLLIISQSFGFGKFQLVQRTQRYEYMKDLTWMIIVLYIFSGVGFVAIPILSLFIMRWVSNPVKNLCLAMEEVESGNLEYHLEGETGTYQMDFLNYSFNHMVEELHHMVTEAYVKEIEKLQTDAVNIRLQVNQHMLLNFLNTIYSLSCAGKYEQVNEFTLLLTNYFRYVLRQDIGLVTVQEEMQFVQDYLKLQKIRFPNSFICVYSVEDGAENLLIPQLLIENFIENIIKYGLILGKEIEILINVRTEDERLFLSICDTGNGMSIELAQRLQRGEIIEDKNGKHIGIWNCKRRLKYYYGENHKLTISSLPNEGTQIWIEILKEPLEQEDAAIKIRQMEKK